MAKTITRYPVINDPQWITTSQNPPWPLPPSHTTHRATLISRSYTRRTIRLGWLIDILVFMFHFKSPWSNVGYIWLKIKQKQNKTWHDKKWKHKLSKKFHWKTTFQGLKFGKKQKIRNLEKEKDYGRLMKRKIINRPKLFTLLNYESLTCHLMEMALFGCHNFSELIGGRSQD